MNLKPVTLEDVLKVKPSYPFEPVVDPNQILTWDEVCCGELRGIRLYYRQRLGLEYTAFPCADVNNAVYLEMVKPPDAILRNMLLDCPETAKEFSMVFKVNRPDIVTFMLSLENENPAFHMLNYLEEHGKTQNHFRLHKLLTWLSVEVGKLRAQWIAKSAEWERALPGISINGKVYWKVPLINRHVAEAEAFAKGVPVEA